MMKVRILFLAITSLFCGSVFGQDTLSLNTLIDKNQKLIEGYPTEKVYLHFDKPYYAVGDTIWFKAYIAGTHDQPSDLSKIVYIDVIAEADTLKRSLRLPVVNTSAYGSLTLDPLLYKAGNYRVRAYTYWMLNGDEKDFYFFNKTIPIGNAITRRVITNATLKGDAGGASRIDAKIVYKDADGKLLKNTRIDWRLLSNFDEISKGRGTTDDQGVLTLSLTASQKSALEAGVLETSMENTLGGAPIMAVFPLKNSFAEADIQFFPEGGDMIQGVGGKVAFKAVDGKGQGVGVKGEIADATGKVVAQLESQHLGMGVIALLPEAGQTYKANLKFDNGVQKSVTLPAVKNAAITLSAINTDPANLLIRVASNQEYFSANQGKGYYIIARSKGVICYAAKASLTGPTFSASIPKDKFPTGIVQLTLFSASGEPLTERLVFVKRPDPMVLAVTSDKKTYGVRQPVKMTVTAKTNNAPVQGNFSVSVINETRVPFDDNKETTILSSFYLSSELKGFIEQPNYYFNDINAKKQADLDVLMMTQGYRKFAYQDILAGKEPVINFLPEQGMEFKGTLRNATGMPVSNGSLRLVSPVNRFYAETSTDKDGVFVFKNANVPDSAEVSITARSSNGLRNMMIMLDGDAFPGIQKNVNTAEQQLNIDSLLSPYLQNSQRQYRLSSQLLQEVVVTAAPIKKKNHLDYPALSGLSQQADYVIGEERFKGCNLMINCLQSAAMGLTFQENQFYVTRVFNSGLRVPVQIFLDGMAIEPTFLNNITPSDVESVEIFQRDELGLVNRTYGTNGVLSIYTKEQAKGKAVTAEDLKKLFPPNNVLTFKPLGFAKTREFYNPKYATPESRNIGSDLRTTVYWNPKVFTDANGTMSFDFYNGDNRGNFKAIVEGTDIDGNLARYIYRYKVE